MRNASTKKQNWLAQLVAGALFCAVLVLTVPGCKTSSATGSGGSTGGGNTTINPAQGSGIIELDVYTAWDTSPTKQNLQKACVVPDGTPVGTNITCKASIPEGMLHFSSLTINTAVNKKGACGILNFEPYFYRASNSAGFLPEWASTAPIDCSQPIGQLSSDCFSGVGVDMLKDVGFPQFIGMYDTPDDDGNITQTFSARSANTAHRFSGNRWTNNTLTYRGASISNPPLADGYVASSMQDYLLTCDDEYGDLQYSITLTIADTDSSLTCDPNSNVCNVYPNWNSTQRNDLTPGGSITSPPAGLVSHTVPALGQNTGATLGTTDFYVDVVPSSSTSAFLHVDGDWTQPCMTDMGNTNQDLVCDLEINEEDLYTQGFSLTYQAPPEQCQYLRRDMYWYYQFQTGSAPTTVNETTTDGVVTALSSAGGDTSVFLDSNSAIHCGFDYSTSSPVAGPNCCEGSYTYILRTQVTGSPDTVTTTVVPWSGKKSNCVNGPAAGPGNAVLAGIHTATAPSAAQPKDAYGYPEPIIEFIGSTAISGLFVAAAPITQAFKSSNVYLSNYWAGPYGLTSSSQRVPTSAPLAFWPGNAAKGASATNAPAGEAFYRFDCLDNGGEYVNRLRIMVRSWSTVSEFNAQGNFLLRGPQGVPFSDHDLLNFFTWPQVLVPTQGFGDSYPGYSN